MAQGALYLGLRHVAVASWPSWAHHRLATHGLMPWPAMVSADIVAGKPAPGKVPPLPAPVMMSPPPVPLPMPELDHSGTTTTPSG